MGGDKAIIFDLGKVLVDFDYSITVRKIISQCAKGPESVLKLIDQSPILHQYESGEMDTLGFYETVVRETGYQGSREGFESAFSGIFTPIHPMIEFFRELIGEGVPVYVLSNTNGFVDRILGMKKLKSAELKSRRNFLKGLAKKSTIPAVVV